MKFILAVLVAVSVTANPFAPQTSESAKARHVSKLLRNAKTIRRLADDYPVDISGYSVKFEKCQFVKSYNDELAEAQGSNTVLGTTRFAIFRLCPENSCDTCDENYGEYLLDLESYLQLSTEYFMEYQDEMCGSCDQWCQYEQQQYQNAQNGQANGDGEERRLNEQQMPEGLNCSQCVEECAKINNMEEKGFVDATEFLNCQKIYDDGDNGGLAYYAAPVCAQDGSKIKIGVFKDQYCQDYESSRNVEDYLDQDENGNGKQLSHALLKNTYEKTCISCKEPQDVNENNDGNDAQDVDQVNDFCENLYNFAGKCEYAHAFQGYFQADGNGYYNQIFQEDVVCGYIKSLKAGTYDETGEINISGSSFSFSGGSNTTAGQKISLTFFILGTVGLAVYAAMLHSKLTKGVSTLEPATGALA